MVMTFIYNYASSGGRRHTIEEEKERRTVALLDPEQQRRTFAMMREAHSDGVDLGIGDGQRPGSAQLDNNGNVKPGFAQPGNSNHQSFPWESDTPTAVACDMVGNLDWMEAHCGKFGLRTFRHVNGEPWHIQPSEIPASRSFRTEPWDLKRFVFAPSGFDPEHGVFGLMPRRKKPDIRPGSPRSRVVMYAQGCMKLRVANFALWFGTVAENRAKEADTDRRRARLTEVAERLFEAHRKCKRLTVDGDFGPQLASAVMAMEDAFNGRKLAGRVMRFDERATIGRNTWFLIDNLADGKW